MHKRVEKNIWSIVALGCILMGACGKCKEKNLESQTFYPIMERYFGVLRPGSWWLMQATAGVQDSVYVENYSEGTNPNLEVCQNELLRTFWIVTRNGAMNRKCVYTTSKRFSEIGMQGGIGAAYNSSTGWEVRSTVDHFGDVHLGGQQFLDVIRLRNDDMTDGLQSMSFAPGVGLIQFVTLTDTFNLLNHGHN